MNKYNDLVNVFAFLGDLVSFIGFILNVIILVLLLLLFNSENKENNMHLHFFNT